MNDKRQMVQVKKTRERGFVVSQNGNQYEVALPDGRSERRDWFSAKELDFLPTPSASEIKELFEGKLTQKMDDASRGMVEASEQRNVRPDKGKTKQ